MPQGKERAAATLVELHGYGIELSGSVVELVCCGTDKCQSHQMSSATFTAVLPFRHGEDNRSQALEENATREGQRLRNHIGARHSPCRRTSSYCGRGDGRAYQPSAVGNGEKARFRQSRADHQAYVVRHRSVATPDRKAVFINVPFDTAYEPLFITLVGMLVFLGQEPHCVLEVRERGEGRLARIIELIRTCRMSIHDLSRVGLPARFNMPFELGLACTVKDSDPAKYEIFVLDSRPYRLDRLLSDYKGRDPLIYDGTCTGMVTCLLDTFDTPVGTAAEFRGAAGVLRKSAKVIKHQLASSSVFRPSLFRHLVAAATKIGRSRGFIAG